MRRLLATCLLPLTIAAAPSPPPTPLPKELASLVKEGHFDPGDYGWTRGAFPGASPTQVADWKAILAYAQDCSPLTPDPAAAAKLAAQGYHVSTEYWQRYATDICSEVAMARFSTEGFASWDGYVRARDASLPYFRTYLFAVDTAQQAAPIDSGSLRDQLDAIAVPDQMLRIAISWGQGDAGSAPALDPDATRFLVARLWQPIRHYDHRNTAWLKARIAAHGWPTISQVGERAATNAWLLAQHADDDPLFQLDVLKLMEPLAAKGEVDKHDFALLTDRVLLPLTGKQRYGTQFTCDDAKGWHPLPLETEAQVDMRRAKMGLGPIADYAKEMARTYGTKCRS